MRENNERVKKKKGRGGAVWHLAAAAVELPVWWKRALMSDLLICVDICLINVCVTALASLLPKGIHSPPTTYSHRGTQRCSAVVFQRDNHEWKMLMVLMNRLADFWGSPCLLDKNDWLKLIRRTAEAVQQNKPLALEWDQTPALVRNSGKPKNGGELMWIIGSKVQENWNIRHLIMVKPCSDIWHMQKKYQTYLSTYTFFSTVFLSRDFLICFYLSSCFSAVHRAKPSLTRWTFTHFPFWRTWNKIKYMTRRGRL